MKKVNKLFGHGAPPGVNECRMQPNISISYLLTPGATTCSKLDSFVYFLHPTKNL